MKRISTSEARRNGLTVTSSPHQAIHEASSTKPRRRALPFTLAAIQREAYRAAWQAAFLVDGGKLVAR